MSPSRTPVACWAVTEASSTGSTPCFSPGRRRTQLSSLLATLDARRPLLDSAQMTRIALLGATGSIGRQALQLMQDHHDLELVAAMSGVRPLDAVAASHPRVRCAVGGDPIALLEACEPDVVLNAIVGFAGIRATLWALEHGVTLALANKESLVAGGALAREAQRRRGGLLIPVDSEHSALMQCLDGWHDAQIESLVLTASGGPFRGRSREELSGVTVEEALAHPTWSMGPKITVDSATLANKGLELIEAHWLFD